MFCTKCGAQIADGTRFCTKCGAPVSSVPEFASPNPTPAESVYTAPTESIYTAPTESVYTAPTESVYAAPEEPIYTAHAEKPKKKTSSKTILIAAAAAAVALIVVLVLCLSGGGYKDYNDLIGDYLAASADGDADAVIELFHPNAIQIIRSTDGSFSDYEILEYLDDWYAFGYYGYPVESWEVTDIIYADSVDISWLEDTLGVYAESWIDAEVLVCFSYGESYYYDFDLICVDGCWYIIDVY